MGEQPKTPEQGEQTVLTFESYWDFVEPNEFFKDQRTDRLDLEIEGAPYTLELTREGDLLTIEFISAEGDELPYEIENIIENEQGKNPITLRVSTFSDTDHPDLYNYFVDVFDKLDRTSAQVPEEILGAESLSKETEPVQDIEQEIHQAVDRVDKAIAELGSHSSQEDVQKVTEDFKKLLEYLAEKRVFAVWQPSPGERNQDIYKTIEDGENRFDAWLKERGIKEGISSQGVKDAVFILYEQGGQRIFINPLEARRNLQDYKDEQVAPISHAAFYDEMKNIWAMMKKLGEARRVLRARQRDERDKTVTVQRNETIRDGSEHVMSELEGLRTSLKEKFASGQLTGEDLVHAQTEINQFIAAALRHDALYEYSEAEGMPEDVTAQATRQEITEKLKEKGLPEEEAKFLFLLRRRRGRLHVFTPAYLFEGITLDEKAQEAVNRLIVAIGLAQEEVADLSRKVKDLEKTSREIVVENESLNQLLLAVDAFMAEIKGVSQEGVTPQEKQILNRKLNDLIQTAIKDSVYYVFDSIILRDIPDPEERRQEHARQQAQATAELDTAFKGAGIDRGIKQVSDVFLFRRRGRRFGTFIRMDFALGFAKLRGSMSEQQKNTIIEIDKKIKEVQGEVNNLPFVGEERLELDQRDINARHQAAKNYSRFERQKEVARAQFQEELEKKDTTIAQQADTIKKIQQELEAAEGKIRQLEASVATITIPEEEKTRLREEGKKEAEVNLQPLIKRLEREKGNFRQAMVEVTQQRDISRKEVEELKRILQQVQQENEALKGGETLSPEEELRTLLSAGKTITPEQLQRIYEEEVRKAQGKGKNLREAQAFAIMVVREVIKLDNQ